MDTKQIEEITKREMSPKEVENNKKIQEFTRLAVSTLIGQIPVIGSISGFVSTLELNTRISKLEEVIGALSIKDDEEVNYIELKIIIQKYLTERIEIKEEILHKILNMLIKEDDKEKILLMETVNSLPVSVLNNLLKIKETDFNLKDDIYILDFGRTSFGNENVYEYKGLTFRDINKLIENGLTVATQAGGVYGSSVNTISGLQWTPLGMDLLKEIYNMDFDL